MKACRSPPRWCGLANPEADASRERFIASRIPFARSRINRNSGVTRPNSGKFGSAEAASSLGDSQGAALRWQSVQSLHRRRDSFMTRIRIIVSITILVVLCAAAGHAQEKKIVMTHVKYDGLKQEVLKHRGKVVVVDFWATWCPSCMEAFPKFIDYQKKYADKGLVVIAVSIDSMEKEGAVERANRFLNKHKSPLR